MRKPESWYTGIIKFEDLPDDVWVDLKPQFRRHMINVVRHEARYLFLLSKRLKEPTHTIKQSKYIQVQAYTLSNFISGKCISLRLLRKLSKFLVKKGYKEFKLKNIQEYIILLKSGKRGKPILNPNFPIDFNSKHGAKFIAAILGDGGIDINNGATYRNEDASLRENFIFCARKVFGEFVLNTKSTQIELPSIIGKLLVSCLGMHSGKKTVNNVGIPDFILSNSKDIIKNFLQQIFDDEGSVTGNANKAKHIKLELSVDVTNRRRNTKPLLLLDLCKLLEIIEIKFRGPYFSREHICKDKAIKHMWHIYIGGVENLTKFSDNIGFFSYAKSRKLKENIIKVKRNLELKKKPRKDMLQKIFKVHNNYGFISTRILCKKYRLPLSRVSFWLTRFENEGMLVKTSNLKTGRKYVLNEKYKILNKL